MMTLMEYLAVTPTLVEFLAVALTLVGFWLVDQCVRRQRWMRLIIPRGPGPTSWWRFAALSLLAGLVSITVDWSVVAEPTAVRVVVISLAALMTWKYVSQDIDVAIGQSLALERLLLIALAAASWMWPVALLPWLYLIIHSFAGWTHHPTVPLRLLMMFLGYCLLVVLPFALIPDLDPRAPALGAGLFVAWIACQASHYVVPAIRKMRLGRHWFSWAVENQLHLVAASSYSWGWLRFLPRGAMIRILHAMKPMDRPLQALTLLFEAGVILSLLHPAVLYAMLAGLVLMHLVIFLSTGILFWDWMVANAALAGGVFMLSPDASGLLFSPASAVACAAIVLLLPVRGRLWSPNHLAWWDTPYTARMHWEVVGESGKIYGLYNNFMCPHERLFGRSWGFFMVDEPIVTYHVGEVHPLEWERVGHHLSAKRPFEPYVPHELRDRIIQSRGRAEAIEEIKARFGAVMRDGEREREHVDYLIAFFRALNAGARKSIFPRWLRWLKAPGALYFYWGEREAFRRQEKVVSVVLRYREEFYDGADFRVLKDMKVREISVVEPTPPVPNLVE